MADRAFPRRAFHAGQEVDKVFFGGHEARFAFGMGTQILPNLGAEIYGNHETRTVVETDAFWFEFGFTIDCQLNGNSAAGFTDAGNYFRIEIQQSEDLVNWNMGKFVPAPVPVVDNGNGTWTYWNRATIPIWWFNVLVDLTVSSNRYGKSITGITVGGAPVSLPGYPYAMPAAAATLQADLRANGYPGATVTNVPAALSVGIVNHTQPGRLPYSATMSGTNVTMVRNNAGTNIPLPGYPYSMPSQRATLQTDLRAAGHSGAVVMLYGDEWTIFLPDRPAANQLSRQFSVTFTPDDPYPAWDFFGTYLGNQPANAAVGESGNVRPGGGGSVIPEALRQFARLKITSGSRYNHLAP